MRQAQGEDMLNQVIRQMNHTFICQKAKSKKAQKMMVKDMSLQSDDSCSAPTLQLGHGNIIYTNQLHIFHMQNRNNSNT